jgi:hypothetical protein
MAIKQLIMNHRLYFVKQHSIFSFYINRYSKLPPPFHLFIKFLMLFLICVRKNVSNCNSPFRHHSKRTIVDQDQNIHFHRKNKPWNKNLLQRAIIIRIFIIKPSNYKHDKICYVNTSMIGIPHVLP